MHVSTFLDITTNSKWPGTVLLKIESRMVDSFSLNETLFQY